MTPTALCAPLWVLGATALAGLLTGYWLGLRKAVWLMRQEVEKMAREREMERQQEAARARLRAHRIEWN